MVLAPGNGWLLYTYLRSAFVVVVDVVCDNDDDDDDDDDISTNPVSRKSGRVVSAKQLF